MPAPSGPAIIPFFAALMFAVHPLQTQAVTYITQRMESLAALFVLAGLLCFVRAAHASRVPQRAMAFAGSAVCLVLGYAAKETALVLPLLALLVDWFWLAAGDFRSLRRRWWMHAALLLCMLVLAAKTLHLLGGFVPAGQVAGGTAKATAGFAVTSISAWEYALTQTNVLLYYIGLVVFPVNQNLDYDYPVARDLLSWPSVREGTILNWPPLPPLLALLAIVALLAGAVIWYRRAGCRSQAARLTLFGLLWYLVAVAPTSSVIPVIDVIYEHRAYLASVGLLLIVTTALKGVSERLPSRSLPSRPGA